MLKPMALGLLSTLLRTTLADGYVYQCSGCHCQAEYYIAGPSDCHYIGNNIRAIGVANIAYDSACYLYASTDCSGDHQGMGTTGGNTWGCTESQFGLDQQLSIICG
jgi:hypothetical protein